MKKLLLGALAASALLIGVPATAGAQTSPATVTLLHGIPGVVVDVFVGGTEVIADFQPGATFNLSPFAGQTLTNVEVKLQDGTVAISAPSVAVPASGNWTVTANLDATGTPVLTPWQNDVAAVPANDGRLIVRHAAAAPAVDIVAPDGSRPVSNLANGQQQALVLPAGTISGLQIAPTGGAPIAAVPSVTLKAGSVLIVYAVGSLSSQPATFTYYTQEIVVTQLPETGAAGVLAQTGIAVLVLAGGAALLAVSRRRGAVAA